MALLLAATSFYELQAKSLEGEPIDFKSYKGKVVLVVNTASECGYTPQYAGLEKLHEELGKKGLVVLGMPSNDFGGQEPGDAKKIRFFCKASYDVSFPLTEKVVTRGKGQHPVYAFLSAQKGEPEWNFHKYLIGRDGRLIAAFPSSVEPGSDKLRTAITEALASP